MRTTKTLIATCLIAGSTLALAEIEWLEPQLNDLRATELSPDQHAVPSSLHHESAPVQFSWRQDPAAADNQSVAGPNATSAPEVQSRQYWIDTSGHELAGGVELPLTAPGAMIRISALDSGTRLLLDPRKLQLEINGHPLSTTPGAGGIMTGNELRRQGMPVPEDTLALDLGDRLEAGRLRVTHDGIRADLPVVIQVHEPNSPWTASLALPRYNFLAGEPLDFDFGLGDGHHSPEIRSIQAVVASPDASQAWPIKREGENRLALDSAPLAISDRRTPGLYEAHVYLESEHAGLTIRRDMTLAFSIAPPIARLDGEVERIGADGLDLVLGVETVAAGRYQINAEVLGSNARGELEPLGYVQSAAVLGAGRGQIGLSVDPALVRVSGLSAPFELRNLQLLDQGRMYLLESREHALRVLH